MNSAELIELSGRRFTPFSKMLGLILILLAGVFLAFCDADGKKTVLGEHPRIEHYRE